MKGHRPVVVSGTAMAALLVLGTSLTPTVFADNSSIPPIVNGIVQISTANQLEYVDENQSVYSSDDIELMNDIDMSGLYWTPISGFDGTFNGNGYTLDHFTIEDAPMEGDDNEISFFGSTNAAAIVENLKFDHVTVSGEDYETVAVVVADNGGVIKGVGVLGGNVSSGEGENDGVLVANNSGTVEDSFSLVNISGEDNTVGDLAGTNEGAIIDSYATGMVSGSGSTTGGLVGSGGGHVIHSYYNSENTSSQGGTPLSLAQMKQSANFNSWDFTDTWGIDPPLNSGYPYLRLAAPGDVTHQDVTSSGWTESWQPVLGAASYNVYLDGREVADHLTTPSYTFTGESPSQSHQVTVAAVGEDGGIGAMSPEDSVETAAVQGPSIAFSDSTPRSGETITVSGTVYDVYDQPVSGAQVTLTSTSGGAPIGSWASPSSTTDANGQYVDQWTAPNAPSKTPITVTASVYGVANQATLVVNPAASGGGPTPPFISTESFMEDAKVGVPFSQQIVATGGAQPYTWSISGGSLPPGLSLNDDGQIVGTPTGQGSQFTFTVKVTDANHLSSTRQLTLAVDGADKPTITTTSLSPNVLGQAYAQTLDVSGGTAPYTWAVEQGILPSGLNLNAKTGVISGSASASGVSTFIVQATDANGMTATQTFQLDVLKPNEREIVWNGEIKNVPAIVGDDGGTQTTYMPIWYVMQLLNAMGIDSRWNGHTWNMTTSSSPDLSNIQAGTGNTSIYLNGTLVQNVNTEAQNDPSTNKPTTYMPIWYVQQILDRVGLQSTWNGTTWTVEHDGE